MSKVVICIGTLNIGGAEMAFDSTVILGINTGNTFQSYPLIRKLIMVNHFHATVWKL